LKGFLLKRIQKGREGMFTGAITEVAVQKTEKEKNDALYPERA
jgi:hypothetical protein